MTSIKQLEIFVNVIENGSFTTAAQNMYMTQPAVSWQIKKLEEELEVILFRRRDRSIELSEAGEMFFRASRDMINIYHQVQSAMAEYKKLGRGRLVIGASTIPGEYVLPPLLPAFCTEHNALDISVKIAPTVEIIKEVAAAQVDIGIVGAQLPVPGIEYQPWLLDRLIPVVAGANTEIPTELSLQQLTKYTMVGRDSQSGTRMTIEDALHKAGMDLSRFPRYISIGSTQGVLGAVAAGMGIAFVSQWVAAPLLKRGELRELKVKGIQIERNFYIASWQTSYPIPGVEALKAFLQGHLEKIPE